MTRINNKLFVLVFFSIAFISCSDSNSTNSPEEDTTTLTLNLIGVEPLKETLIYEGWLMVNEQPFSVGRFNTQSLTTEKIFSVPTKDLNAATSFILSIEETNSQNSKPSDTKLLFGNFVSNTADLNFEVAVGFVIDPTIEYNLHCNTMTPTDGTTNPLGSDENYGLWFQNSLGPGLSNIPILNKGWKYEGWVFFNGTTPLSTGKFTSHLGPDESSYYCGDYPGNNYPGEDFLKNLPNGVSGYVVGSPVVITIEPDLTSDLDIPFYLRPISGVVVEGLSGTSLDIKENYSSSIFGTAIRE